MTNPQSPIQNPKSLGPVRVLYIDDYPLDRELVRDALEKEHGGFQIIEAASREEFETRLGEQDYDIVLSDFNILGFEGLQVLDAVKEKFPQVPVIIVTGTGSEEVAVETMKRGASDYVIKSPSHIRRLPHTIRAALEKKRLRDERERAENKIRHLSLVLRAIRNVNQLILRVKDRDRLLQRACENLIETRGYYNAWVVILDETGGFVTAAQAGLDKDFLSIVERFKEG